MEENKRLRKIILCRNIIFGLLGVAVLASIVIGINLLSKLDEDDEAATKELSREQITEENTEETSTEMPIEPGGVETTYADTQNEKQQIDINHIDEDTYSDDYYQDNVKSSIYFFDVILPEGKFLSKKWWPVQMFEYGDVYGIEVEGYDAMSKYPYADESHNLISAGWVELSWLGWDEGDYYYIDGVYPHPKGDFKHFYNYEEIDGGYICEAEIDVINNISDEEILNLPVEQTKVNYWCVIFEKKSRNMSESDWIFLNKDCFSKEDAKAIAETYIPSYKCGMVDGYLYKGDTFYAIREGYYSDIIDYNAEPITSEWHDVHMQWNSRTSRDVMLDVEFSWCNFRDEIHLINGFATDGTDEWEVILESWNLEELMLRLVSEDGIEYASYDINTGTMDNMFKNLDSHVKIDIPPIFSNDNCKAVIRSEREKLIYYYDISAQNVVDLSEVYTYIEGYIYEATICDDKVFIYMGVDGEKRGKVYEYNIHTGEIRENAIGDIKFMLHDTKNYTVIVGGEYAINLERCNETGVLEIYNLDTESYITTEITMDEMIRVLYSEPETKCVIIRMSDGMAGRVDCTTGKLIERYNDVQG